MKTRRAILKTLNNENWAYPALPAAMECISKTKNNDLALNVYVQPRAANNRIAGVHGNAIKVCVTAPPVDDKANTAVMALVAELFGVARSHVSIRSGRQARNKKVVISKLTLKEAEEILSRAIPLK
jgi:hypothetical protein